MDVDLTERKKAEEALRASEHQYAGLVNNIDGIVWEADLARGHDIRQLSGATDSWLSSGAMAGARSISGNTTSTPRIKTR
jgi:PAS domain-containing protein